MIVPCLVVLAALPLIVSAVPVSTSVGVSIPLTKRSRLLNGDGTVRLDVLRSEIVKVRSKLDRGFQAFEKNTGTVHSSDTRKFAKRATGADPLTDDDEALWQGAISVGTPATRFTVDFDTGSSDLFLPGTNCNVNCQGHTLYNTGSSSTARSLGRTFSLAFGDGSTVQGQTFTDTVTIAGLTATGQTLGSATQYSAGFAIDEFPPDGLMGMAFPQISVFGASPVFQTLVSQGRTTNPEFAFKLADSGSELLLGGVNNALFTGSFTQNRVTDVGFWQIDLQSVNVNGRAAASGLSAIVDTGTTLLLGDANNVARVYSQISGSRSIGGGLFSVPCNAIPDNISLTFGGRAFTISAATFNLGLVSAGSSQCVGGLGSVDFNGLWIVGDVFLRNVYTSFNTGTQQVGFATLA